MARPPSSPPAASGLFIGQAESFQSEWQLTNPQMVLFGAQRATATTADAAAEAVGRRCTPIYPLTKGVESWDLQRAMTFARSVIDDLPDVMPEPSARSTT